MAPLPVDAVTYSWGDWKEELGFDGERLYTAKQEFWEIHPL